MVSLMGVVIAIWCCYLGYYIYIALNSPKLSTQLLNIMSKAD